MKINKLYLTSYGKFNELKINLKNGINLIDGENESGKSTISSFINAMLFGHEKSRAINLEKLSEYSLYKPWFRESYQGSIEYTLDNGQTFIVSRNFNNNNINITTSDGKNITDQFKKDKKNVYFFEEQTGFDKETFKNTALSMQKLVVLDNSKKAEVVEKMVNIIEMGEETLSFDDISNKLTMMQREEIGSPRTKNRPYNIIEEKLNRIKKEQYEISKISDKKGEVDQEYEQIQDEYSEIEEKRKLILELKDYYLKREVLLKNQEELLLNIRNLKKINNETKEKQILNETLNLEDKKSNFSIVKNVCENKSIKNFMIIFYSLIMLISLSIIGIGIKNNNVKITKIFSIVSLLISIFAIIDFIIFYLIKRSKNNEEKYIEHEKKLNENINNLNLRIDELELEYENKKNEMLKRDNEFAHEVYTKYSSTLEPIYIERQLKKSSYELSEEEKLLHTKSNSIAYKLSSIDSEKISLDQLKDKKAYLEEKREEYENQMQELINTSESIDLAKEILVESYNEIKKGIGPRFNSEMSSIVSYITNGKYKNVLINDNHEIVVQRADLEYISILALSTGTIEQINLALRIAFLDSISQKEEMPIILDESLVYYDNTRLSNILKLLADIYRERQIILFSSTKREKNIMQELKLPFNYILL